MRVDTTTRFTSLKLNPITKNSKSSGQSYYKTVLVSRVFYPGGIFNCPVLKIARTKMRVIFVFEGRRTHGWASSPRAGMPVPEKTNITLISQALYLGS